MGAAFKQSFLYKHCKTHKKNYKNPKHALKQAHNEDNITCRCHYPKGKAKQCKEIPVTSDEQAWEKT